MRLELFSRVEEFAQNLVRKNEERFQLLSGSSAFIDLDQAQVNHSNGPEQLDDVPEFGQTIHSLGELFWKETSVRFVHFRWYLSKRNTNSSQSI